MFIIKMSNQKEIVEDFLDVDKPITGQNYVCLSFLSPENMIEKRELFLLEQFRKEFLGLYEQWNVNHQSSYELLQNIRKTMPDTFINESENENITIAVKDIKNLNNQLAELQSKFDLWNFINNKKSMNEFYDEFNIHKKEHYSKVFADENKNACSMRGLKCRGVYHTLEEAQSRAKKLQKKDKYFNVFVGQVGFWLPWDPNPYDVENQEDAEPALNELMKNYKKNKDTMDEVWEENVRQRKEMKKK